MSTLIDDISVDLGVCSPQEDSDLLLDSLAKTRPLDGRRVADMCTGSGVVAIAAARYGAVDVGPDRRDPEMEGGVDAWCWIRCVTVLSGSSPGGGPLLLVQVGVRRYRRVGTAVVPKGAGPRNGSNAA